MKLIILFYVLQGSFFTLAQSYHGYYGKRNYIDLLSVSHSPIVYNLFKSGKVGYDNDDGTLIINRGNWFNSGIHISGGRTLNNHLAVGFEYGVDFKKVPAPFIYSQSYFQFWGSPYYVDGIAHEDVQIIRHDFLPKIEISKSDGLMPMGLSYSMGLGLTVSKIRRKDYLMEFLHENYNGEISTSDIPEELNFSSADIFDYQKRYFGLQVMGAIRMRTPLTSYLFLSYGVRYMLNIKLYNTLGYETETSMRGILSRSSRTNFISLDLGLTVPF